MTDSKQAKPKCGYLKKDGTPCRHPAGYRTDHLGEGYCKYHRGNGNNRTSGKERSDKQIKHGLYQRFFDPEQIEQAKELQGGLIQEIAIARLQLVRLLELKEANELYLSKAEIREIERGESLDKVIDKIKNTRAKFAKKAGEYYDPDDDDFDLPDTERKDFEIKKEYKSIDFFSELSRILLRIESMERTQMTIESERAAMIRAEKGKDEEVIDEYSDEHLDREICELLEITEDGTD